MYKMLIKSETPFERRAFDIPPVPDDGTEKILLLKLNNLGVTILATYKKDLLDIIKMPEYRNFINGILIKLGYQMPRYFFNFGGDIYGTLDKYYPKKEPSNGRADSNSDNDNVDINSSNSKE